MDLEILAGGAIAMIVVAYGFAMTLIRSMQAIDVLSMVSVEAYHMAATVVGVILIPVIFVIGKYLSGYVAEHTAGKPNRSDQKTVIQYQIEVRIP